MMTVSPSTVTATAGVTATAPTVTVTATFANAPSTVYFMTSDYSTNGVSSVSAPVYNSTQGSFTVQFKTPSGLKPATYADTDTLLLCSDPQCQSVLVKYPLAINYTVTAASSAPQVTLDSTSLSYQALAIDQYAVTVTPDPTAFTFTNFTAPPFVNLSAPTTGGIDTLVFTMSDATHGGITFTFKTPSQLGAGSYTTPVTVTVCLDSTCANQVATYQLTVNYLIGNTVTVAGTHGYTMTVYPVTATAVAAVPSSSVIYAATSPTAASDPDSVVALNPTNGNVQLVTLPASHVPGDQTYLALSDDGSMLYVYASNRGNVDRVPTSTLMTDLSISVPTSGGSLTGIAVAPGQPQTIAVTNVGELQIFDDSVARPNAYTVSATSSLSVPQWGSLSQLFIVFFSGIGSYCSLAVNATGVTGTNSCFSHLYLPDAYVFANGFIYENAGVILDAATWAQVGSFTTNQNEEITYVLPDTTTDQAFAGVTNLNGGCSIQSFDLTTQAAIASVRLPVLNVPGSFCISTGSRGADLVRWGTNGLAYIPGTSGSVGYVIVITGAFVGP
jgi:hypothetical protein